MYQGMSILAGRLGSLLKTDPGLSLHELTRTIDADRDGVECSIQEQHMLDLKKLKRKDRLSRAVMRLAEGQTGLYLEEIAALIGVKPNALPHLIRSAKYRPIEESQFRK